MSGPIVMWKGSFAPRKQSDCRTCKHNKKNGGNCHYIVLTTCGHWEAINKIGNGGE